MVEFNDSLSDKGIVTTDTSSEINFTKEVQISGTKTNAFTDAEQTKLSGIEADATIDQTGAEIKTAYEGESDTNAFTDAERATLGNITADSAVDLADLATKSNVLELDNTTAFTPDADYEPATKKYVDDEIEAYVVDLTSDILLNLPLKNNTDMVQGEGSVTVNRAGTATYIDRYGVVQDLASGEVGFDKDGADLPPASTNQTKYNEDLSNAVWNQNTDVSLTYSIDDPNGGTTATTLTADAANAVFGQYNVLTSGDEYTGSWWIKRRTGTGTIGLIIGDNTIQELDVTDEWQRLDKQNTTTSTTVRNSISIAVSGDAVDVWVPQCEKLPFSTPVIPTTSAAAARLGATLSFPYAENSPDTLRDKTVVLDVAVIGLAASYQSVFYSRGLALNTNHSDTLVKPYVTMGTGFTPINQITLDFNETFRYGATFDAENTTLKMYVKGVFIGQRTTLGTIGNPLTDIVLGDDEVYLKVKNLKIYDKCLTEDQMRIA